MNPNTLTVRRKCPEGTVFTRIVHDEAGDPHTFLISVGKAGSRLSAQADMMARLLGAAVRAGADLQNLVEMTEGIAHADSNGPETAASLPDAVAQSIKEFSVFANTEYISSDPDPRPQDDGPEPRKQFSKPNFDG